MATSFTDLVIAFAEETGTDIRALRVKLAAAENKMGDLSTLTTTEKSTLVGAIKEIKASIDSVSGDYVTSSGAQTLIDNAIAAVINGAPTAFDTIKEIADYIASDQTASNAITLALSKRVRVDAAQTFTDVEKAQGRSNIGAAAAEDLGDVSTFDPKAKYVAQRDKVA